jgi:E3 ubiquitin-protein ligase MGRN1
MSNNGNALPWRSGESVSGVLRRTPWGALCSTPLGDQLAWTPMTSAPMIGCMNSAIPCNTFPGTVPIEALSGWGRTRLLRHGLRARELRHPLETNPVVSLESAVAHIRCASSLQQTRKAQPGSPPWSMPWLRLPLSHTALVRQRASPQGRAATAAGGGYPGQRMGVTSMQQFYLEGMRPEAGSAFLPRGPAPPPQVSKTCTIRNDVNLKKGSMRLVRDAARPTLHHLEFTFDASSACTIRVFYYATEEVGANGALKFTPLKPSGAIAPEDRAQGLGQAYRAQLPLNLAEYTKEELKAGDRFPIIVALESKATSAVNAQATFANAVFTDAGATVVPLKQKIQVVNPNPQSPSEAFLLYELQEIFGIEGASGDGSALADGDGGDNGRECVVCMTAPRDTTVLPCRHMCLCSGCAHVLRMQAEKCPICRTPIQQLLQIKIAPGVPVEIPPPRAAA